MGGNLGKITINFTESEDKDMFDSIFGKLVELFGMATPTVESTDFLGYTYISYYWVGDVVSMTLFYHYKKGDKFLKGPYKESIELTIESKKIEKEYLYSRF